MINPFLILLLCLGSFLFALFLAFLIRIFAGRELFANRTFWRVYGIVFLLFFPLYFLKSAFEFDQASIMTAHTVAPGLVAFISILPSIRARSKKSLNDYLNQFKK